MADVVAPVAPVVTPTNGVAKTEPVAPARDYEKEIADAKREAITHRRLLEQAKKEKLGLGQKLSEYDALKKKDAEWAAKEEQWKRREAQVKAAFGEKYTELVEDRLTPQDVERMLKQRDDAYRAEREAEKQKQAQTEQERQAKADQQARKQLHSGAQAFLDASAEEYPIFKGKPDIARVLASRFEARLLASRDEEGSLVPDPKLSFKSLADEFEKEMLDLRDELNKHPKYAAKPAVVADPKSPVEVVAKSKTLSNDLTGSTQVAKPKRSEAERLKAADEAFRAKHKA